MILSSEERAPIEQLIAGLLVREVDEEMWIGLRERKMATGDRVIYWSVSKDWGMMGIQDATTKSPLSDYVGFRFCRITAGSQ